MHYKSVKGILSAKNGMNLYRGCSHGCIYCDSRSACYQIQHDFEDIEVKENSIELLNLALSKKRSRCMIGTGSMTDPYIPLELEYCYVRSAMELIYKYGFGFTVQTKSDRILRDLDLLKKINERAKCVVQMTLTTSDEELCKILEPNVCTTSKRVEVLNILAENGIPTVVWLCPILPFINDTIENLEGILDCCIKARVHGIICFGMGLTLREGNREYFYERLDRFSPGMKARYQRTYGDNYIVDSPRSEELMKLFHQRCEEHGILHDNDAVFKFLAELEEEKYEQLSLF